MLFFFPFYRFFVTIPYSFLIFDVKERVYQEYCSIWIDSRGKDLFGFRGNISQSVGDVGDLS